MVSSEVQTSVSPVTDSPGNPLADGGIRFELRPLGPTIEENLSVRVSFSSVLCTEDFGGVQRGPYAPRCFAVTPGCSVGSAHA